MRSGGTDNHLLVFDVRRAEAASANGLDGVRVALVADACGIVTNKDDACAPSDPFPIGLRLGVRVDSLPAH